MQSEIDHLHSQIREFYHLEENAKYQREQQKRDAQLKEEEHHNTQIKQKYKIKELEEKIKHIHNENTELKI